MRARRIILVAVLCMAGTLTARIARAATWESTLERVVTAQSIPEQKRLLGLVADGVRLIPTPKPADSVRAAAESDLIDDLIALIDGKVAVEARAAGCTTFNSVETQEQCLLLMNAVVKRAPAIKQAQEALKKEPMFNRLHEVRLALADAYAGQVERYRAPLAAAKRLREQAAARQREADIEEERHRLAQQEEFARQAENAEKQKASQYKKTSAALTGARRALDSHGYASADADVGLPAITSPKPPSKGPAKTSGSSPSYATGAGGYVRYGGAGDASIDAMYAESRRTAELEKQRIAQIYASPAPAKRPPNEPLYKSPQEIYRAAKEDLGKSLPMKAELEKQRLEKERVEKERREKALAEELAKRVMAENAAREALERERAEAARQLAETRLRSEVRTAVKRILEAWGFIVSIDQRPSLGQTLYAKFPPEDWVKYRIATEDMAEYDGSALAGKIRTAAARAKVSGLIMVLNRAEPDSIEDGDYDDLRESLRESLPDAKLKELIMIHAGDARPLIAGGAVLDEE